MTNTPTREEMDKEVAKSLFDEMEEAYKSREAFNNGELAKRKNILDHTYGKKIRSRVLKNMEDREMGVKGIVDRPTGTKQTCEYGRKWKRVEQHNGYEADDYYGFVYFELPDQKFLKVSYVG